MRSPLLASLLCLIAVSPALGQGPESRPAGPPVRETVWVVTFRGKEIGTELGISAASVDSYRLRLMQKLGAKSRADLVDYALRAGLLRPRSRES